MRWFQDYWLCRLCTLHLPTNIQTYQISEQFYLHLSIHFRPILHRQMCPLTDRQESNTLCPPCVMNSTILFSKWRSHYQNLYLEHGKVSHLDARFLHYRLPLLPSSTTVRQMAGLQACFLRKCSVRPCRGHRANPSKQSAVRSPQSSTSGPLMAKVWTLQHGGVLEMHNNLWKTWRKEYIWEKFALTLTF